MRVELPETHLQEVREYLAARRDAMLAEIDHTDTLEFRRLLVDRYDRLEETLAVLDRALSAAQPAAPIRPAG